MKPLTRLGLLVLPLALAVVSFGALVASPQLRSVASSAVTSARSPLVQAAALTFPQAGSNAQMTELVVRDVVPLVDLGTHAVMLVSKDGESVLPIFVSEEAAVSIAFRLAQRAPPHPLAADLLDGVVTSLGGSVTEIRIDDIEGEVFTGRVFIQQGKKNLELNARPSDAICMALAGEARIFASSKVMTQGGISKNEIDQLRRSMPGVGGSGPDGSALVPPHPVPMVPFHGGAGGYPAPRDGGMSL